MIFFILLPIEERELFHIEITLQKPKDEWRNKKLEPDMVGKAIDYFEQKPIRTVPLYYKQSQKKRMNHSLIHLKICYPSIWV